jgi:hypothetical protein
MEDAEALKSMIIVINVHFLVTSADPAYTVAAPANPAFGFTAKTYGSMTLNSACLSPAKSENSFPES